MKGTVTYAKKWTNHSKFELTCAGFSRSGALVAYGGVDGLAIASVGNGQLKAVVRHQHASVVALEWLQGDLIACAFSNGAIAKVALSTVSQSFLLSESKLIDNLNLS